MSSDKCLMSSTGRQTCYDNRLNYKYKRSLETKDGISLVSLSQDIAQASLRVKEECVREDRTFWWAFQHCLQGRSLHSVQYATEVSSLHESHKGGGLEVILFAFMDEDWNKQKKPTKDANYEREVIHYLDEPVEDQKEDPLHFRFPNLSILASTSLGVPASSTPVERFSIAGKVFRPDRCRLKAKTFERLLFVVTRISIIK